MYTLIIDLIRLIIPLSKEKKKKLDLVASFVDPEELKKVRYFFKIKKVDIEFSRVKVSSSLVGDMIYPKLIMKTKDKKIQSYIDVLNKDCEKKVKVQAFRSFSKVAEKKIIEHISPDIYGLDQVKYSCMLQLFSRPDEPIHILLLGDPGTGKTNIMKSASKLSPVSASGLGSGTSSAGLGVMVKGKEVIEGILPRANLGLCCIDELNLMKRDDYAFLYSAMENGIVEYNKAGRHFTLDAKVKILATANPKGDKFVGRIKETMLKQIPFDSALLSRFHLIFLIRKPGEEGFLHIARKIVKHGRDKVRKNDIEFIKEYIGYAHDIDVEFPSALESVLVEYAKEIKGYEKDFLLEFGPRNIVGFIRLAKSLARISLRRKVNMDDMKRIRELMLSILIFRKAKDKNDSA